MFFSKLKEYLATDLSRLKPKRIKSYIISKKNKIIEQEERLNNAIEQDMSGSKLALSLIWQKKFWIIGLTVLFMALLCVVFYSLSDNTLTTTMSLNYQEGSKGLNPNSTRFNMYELKSNAVMERALRYMGLTGDIAPEELANNISIDNSDQKAITYDASDQSGYFISTSFKVKYNRNKNMGSISTQDIMTMICKAYNDIFHENYSDKRTVLTFDIGDTSDMEYVEIGDALTRHAQQMNEYLSRRVSENGTFKAETTGQTFQTVNRLVQNLVDYDISKYESYVLETGLAKNKTEFIQTLYYKNSVLDIKYQKAMADYSVRQDGISKYDEAMIGTVMIPAVNSNNEYYMSRTNIGIDYLAKDAETHLSQAKDLLKEIEINTDIINKLSERTPTLEDYTKAEEMLKNINKDFEKISQLALETDREYIKYKTKDYLTFKLNEKSLLEKLEWKKVAAGGAIFFVCLCVLFYIMGKRSLAGRGDRA